MTAELVSVIVPVHDGEGYLADALASLAAQTYSPIEVVVVDDGSTDATPEMLRSTAGIVTLRQVRAGPAVARNAGVAAARGTLLAFLDADDVATPDKIARQVAYLAAAPDVGCVFGRQRIFGDADATWLRELPPWMRWAPAWDRREQIQPMTMLVRRATFDAVGPFDPSLVPAEDTDWVLRAVEAGVGIHILDDVVLERRAHDRNISADPEVARQQHFALIKARIDRRRAAACE